jgi:hypothetical protein
MAKELDKHKKYKIMYGSNELFWGVGIEEESYFQFTKPIHVATPIIRTCHKAERYSVDYYTGFKSGYLTLFDQLFLDASGCIPLPFFFNGHSFEKMDLSGQHATTYEKDPKPNPRFGKSFFHELQAFSSFFKDEYEKKFCFDGDTIEFITQGFYKTRVDSVVKELIDTKIRFLKGVNDFLVKRRVHRDKGLLMYPPVNPGFAVFYSNPRNVLMFNNGTYHINITLPTMLGKKDETGLAPLLYPELFKDQHRQYIRYIQWIEPFLVALYGTADPFSKKCQRYSKASQRCAMSRYISIGTYDTVAMTEGKLLTVPLNEIRGSRLGYWWYKQYHMKSGYMPLDKIGMDINYKKHYNHGVELRIFDWFPENRLVDLSTFLVYLADASLCLPDVGEACMSESWNDFVVSVLDEGKDYKLPDTVLGMYEKIFGFDFVGKTLTVETGFAYMFQSLKRVYKMGFCAKCML